MNLEENSMTRTSEHTRAILKLAKKRKMKKKKLLKKKTKAEDYRDERFDTPVKGY